MQQQNAHLRRWFCNETQHKISHIDLYIAYNTANSSVTYPAAVNVGTYIYLPYVYVTSDISKKLSWKSDYLLSLHKTKKQSSTSKISSLLKSLRNGC